MGLRIPPLVAWHARLEHTPMYFKHLHAPYASQGIIVTSWDQHHAVSVKMEPSAQQILRQAAHLAPLEHMAAPKDYHLVQYVSQDIIVRHQVTT